MPALRETRRSLRRSFARSTLRTFGLRTELAIIHLMHDFRHRLNTNSISYQTDPCIREQITCTAATEALQEPHSCFQKSPHPSSDRPRPRRDERGLARRETTGFPLWAPQPPDPRREPGPKRPRAAYPRDQTNPRHIDKQLRPTAYILFHIHKTALPAGTRRKEGFIMAKDVQPPQQCTSASFGFSLS